MKQEKQMTEAEIMKALECASFVYKNEVLTFKGIPIEEFSKAVVDLINRKNAENERLKKIINTSAIILPARKCGKTFLIKTTIEKITESARTAARAEAIKEFAERVKSKGYTNSFCKLLLSKEDIDQIAKEMGVEL